MKEFEWFQWFEWFEWFGPSPIEPFNSGGGGSAENNAALNAHNFYRCMHGAPPMTWDTRVEAKAREWAQRGKFDHSPNSFRTINGVYHGENLAMGWGGMDMVTATKMWYDEIKLTPGKQGRVDDFSMETGHYTQVAESGRPGRAELLAKRPHGRLRRLSAELENVGEASGKPPTF